MTANGDQAAQAPVPLCVDLDGTLIRTDLLIESALLLLKRNILYLFMLPLWLLGGKAHLKGQISRRVTLEVAGLPYDEALLRYLQGQHGSGRVLHLVTASHDRYARQVAEHVGLFTQVLASDDTTNLAGTTKRDRLVALFGKGGFDYAGNSTADLPIWAAAQHSIVVNPEPGVVKKANALGNVQRVLSQPTGLPGLLVRALRLHQWVKNILVLVPLVMAHQVDNMGLLMQGVAAFFAFGLCASSVYVLNDLLDLSADRQHQSKCLRPFTCGALPLKWGLVLVPMLLLASLAVAATLTPQFVGWLALYFGVTLAYSFKLKEMVLVDVLVLAGLYTLRILAGAAAVAVPVSFWLLAFSVFFFFSLALLKRYAELAGQRQGGDGIRGYVATDLNMLSQSGIVSGFMAVLVLALYINSEQVVSLYHRPQLIWLICPLLLLWINRVWLLAFRGQMDDDPVSFALTDWPSYIVGTVVLALLWLAV